MKVPVCRVQLLILRTFCTRISFAIYKADGSVYEVKNQQVDDPGFGTLSISIPEGTYRLL